MLVHKILPQYAHCAELLGIPVSTPSIVRSPNQLHGDAYISRRALGLKGRAILMGSAEGDAEQQQLKYVPTTVNDPGISFLLSEFETARAFMTYEVSAGDKRTDFLLTVVSAAGAGLIALSQAMRNFMAFLYLMLAVSSSLLILSLLIYIGVLRTEISAVGHIRAINVIRQHFENHYPYIKSALALSRNPHHPRFGRLGGNRRIVMVIIATLCASMAAVSTLLIRNETNLDGLTIQISSIAFLGACLILELAARKRYRIAERRHARNVDED